MLQPLAYTDSRLNTDHHHASILLGQNNPPRPSLNRKPKRVTFDKQGPSPTTRFPNPWLT